MFSIGFLLWGGIASFATVVFGLILRKNLQIFSALFMFVVFYILSWLTLPPFSIDMIGTWVMLMVATGAAAGMTIMLDQSNNKERSAVAMIVPVFFFLAIIVGSIASSGLFRSNSLAAVIDITDNGIMESTLSLVSQEQAQRVTSDLALKRGAELIGSAEESGLASRTNFGEIYAGVSEAGEPVWISPLVHSSFFRWLGNQTTPGYFVASHIHSTDAELVEDQPIAYGSEGFYWAWNLNRHIYLNGYVNFNFGEPFFQVDDAGVPHYVVPLERPQVGFFANYPERWLIVNATTGDITEANEVSEIPAWVDRAYSQDTIEARLEDWGCLSQGWWACYFTSENVIDPTPGMVVTMDETGTMIYVTGTQFARADSEATSGVATVNARTGEVQFYRRAGITEVTAVQTINGAVSNFDGWSAENPILIQVSGMETYFSVITDANRARKGFGLVSQRSRDIYGTGDTVTEAVRAYLRSARENQGIGAFEGNADLEPTFFEGLLLSLQPVIQDGDTYFYVRLDTVDDKVFLVGGANSAEVAVSLVGEPIVVSTINTEPAVIEVDTFDNLVLTLDESELQEVLDARAASVFARYEAEVQRSDLEATIDRLSPEDVELLLQELRGGEDG